MDNRQRHPTVHDVALPRGDAPPAIVLGLGQNGLATVRALGRAGIPVIGIDTDLEQPPAQTRYCTKVYSKDFLAGGPGLLDDLVALGRRLERKGVLFPSGDLNVSLVSEQREALAAYYHYALPPKDVLRLLLNKKAFYQLAIREGFPLPRTYFSQGNGDFRKIAAEIAYPCLIKPFQPNAEWRRTFDTRLFLADSPEMLIAIYECIVPVHQDLIIQEYMPGADSEVYWGVTYLDEHGEPLATWTGRKLRMYPRGFGTATLAESVREPWIAAEAVRILRAIGHRGYGVVEFKRDRRDGRFKITEATGGRTWFPHGLVTSSGINLPLIMYRHLLGLPVERPASFREGIKWIHEERDLKTVSLYFLPEKKLTLWSWLRSYRGRRTYAYAAFDDPKVILSAAGRVARAVLRRITRRLRCADPARARHEGKNPSHIAELLLAADPTVCHSLRRVRVD
jgi:predicted ATP-grasp superfamily ATP-dependent carboligase